MPGDIDHLAGLDRADAAELQARKALEEIRPRLAGPERRIATLVKTLEQARAALEKLALDRRRSEAEVLALRAEATRLRSQSVQVKSPQAFQALEHEVDAAEQKKSQHENRILELMEKEEAGALKVAAAEEGLGKGRAEGAEALGALRTDLAGREAAHRACEAARAEILAHMSPAFRSKYDRLRGSKQGVAIARVERDACSSCGSHLTPQALMELKRRDNIPMCEGCSRLLYWTGV